MNNAVCLCITMTTANAHAALPFHQELFFTCILSLNPYNHPMREVLLLSLFFFFNQRSKQSSNNSFKFVKLEDG